VLDALTRLLEGGAAAPWVLGVVLLIAVGDALFPPIPSEGGPGRRPAHRLGSDAGSRGILTACTATRTWVKTVASATIFTHVRG